MGWHIVWKPFVHSIPISNCAWPIEIVVVARIISKLYSIITLGSIFGPKQSEVFKIHEVTGHFINSELYKISLMAEAIKAELP